MMLHESGKNQDATSTYQADNEARCRTIPGGEWLQSRGIRKSGPIEALQPEPAVEADVSDTDTKPRHQSSDRC